MRTIRVNDVNYDVYLAKLALHRALGYNGDFTNVFNEDFVDYVKDFQTAKDLVPDGTFGPLTWQAALPFLYGFTIHDIAENDTIYKIANYYQTTVNSIFTANPDIIDANNIRVGYRLVVPYAFNLVTDKIPYSFILTQFIIYGLKARYPNLELSSIGNSVMGRSIYSMKIGNSSKEVFYNASHHANEWITTPLLLSFAEEYLKSYSTGGMIHTYNASYLYNLTSLYIVPLVNPDGVDLVNNAIDSESSYYTEAQTISERYPNISFPDGWKANINGVDLNLNYPAYWEEAQKIKFAQGFTTPAPRDFVGEAPLSAVESKAVYDFTLAHNFRLTLSYHTQGEVIYWKFLDFNPEGSYDIALKFQRSSGYEVLTTPVSSGYAGYKDWFILNYNLPGYTIEAGRGINPLPITQLPDMYVKNIGILTDALTV